MNVEARYPSQQPVMMSATDKRAFLSPLVARMLFGVECKDDNDSDLDFDVVEVPMHALILAACYTISLA